mmetsp:Transcript_7607/g.19715  ORF Transcript_7607/g.19715 Transcript_7607/m.19715 type:complete len:88 (+) Transcript_7607:438-701(+)
MQDRIKLAALRTHRKDERWERRRATKGKRGGGEGKEDEQKKREVNKIANYYCIELSQAEPEWGKSTAVITTVVKSSSRTPSVHVLQA